ncbi:MAG: xanthine dehydrogenase family protein molybdopterin-binding subunit [Gammaproteobacteria bacterium]|nr:xanthine dehydrogenase family protein molybdopterin-binding subunit [Gammaproteobacteria bacterium]
MNQALTRREFLSHSLAGGALVVAAPLLGVATGRPIGVAHATGYQALSLLAKIHPDNNITFYYPSPEMGQGVDTSLASLFIEELGGDIDLVSVEPMPYLIERNAEGELQAAAVPQFAGGSTSISRNFPLLREAGAGVKQLLLQAAAEQSGQPIKQLRADKSYIVSDKGDRWSFGSLAAAAAQQSLPDDFKAELTPRDKWQVIGQHRKSAQLEKIVTGQPLYGMDIDYPGAKVALVARSPYLDGQVKSLDDSKARALPGVHAVVQLPRPPLDKYYSYLAAGVAVLTDDFWTAKKARDLLEIEWDQGPHSEESTDSLDQQCRSLLKGKGQIVRDDGDLGEALRKAHKVIRHTYQLPTISHAQLEPQNCIAHVEKERCTVIGPFQSPGGAGRAASAITGLDRLQIDVRYTRLGGGFGRRLSSDHAAEAVTISQLSGMPVKLIWTREDDLAHDFYRPMGHHEMIAAVDKKGGITGWAQRLAGRPKYYRRDGVKPEELFGADIYVDDFPAALVKNLQYEYMPAESGLPQGSWRAPAHTANAFVVQSFLDEIAEQTGQDPLQLRLDLLGKPQQLDYSGHGGPVFDTGRMAQVLKSAAERADWGRDMPPGHAQGLAVHFTFGGYCAQVAEVERLARDRFKVHYVSAAIDVGTVINPNGVIAQVEGGINDGLSTAIGQQILVRGGRVTTDNFDTYRMLRIADSVPKIDVIVVDSDAPSAGAGEMATPPLAPAVANALRRAGGQRLRAQPFRSA